MQIPAASIDRFDHMGDHLKRQRTGFSLLHPIYRKAQKPVLSV
jgi:hypothetical protein